jgi:hypothetical protein
VNQDEYPALWQFLGAYLHQDWRADYSDTSEALSDFLMGEPALAPLLAPEIDGLLDSIRTSEEAEAAVLELGSFFVPSAQGQDCKEWLLLLRAQASRTRQAG